MTTVADSVTSINSLNSKSGFGNHFHRINTDGLAVDACLLNQDTVLLVVTSSGSRNVRTGLGGGTSDCGGSISITIPIVEDTCCELVADIGCEGHIGTGTNGILIVSDLYIDSVIDIYIIGFACHGATGRGVGHHESELIGISTSGKYRVDAGNTSLERSIGFSPFVIIAVEIIIDVRSQLNGVVQTDHRGTGNFNRGHRAHIDCIKYNRVGSASADALGHRNSVDVSGLNVVFAIEGFSEHRIGNTCNFLTVSIPFIYISRRSITCIDFGNCIDSNLSAGTDGVRGNFHLGDLGHIHDMDFDRVARGLTGGGQVRVDCIVLIEVCLVSSVIFKCDSNRVALLEEGVICRQINPVVGDTRNFI